MFSFLIIWVFFFCFVFLCVFFFFHLRIFILHLRVKKTHIMIEFSPIFTNGCMPYISIQGISRMDKRLPAEHIVKCRKHPELTLPV